MCPEDPGAWSESDVAIWLNSCNLGQYVSVFQGILKLYILMEIIQSISLFVLENEIDGSALMDDSFDETMIKELIPIMRYRLKFNAERKKLRFVQRYNCFKL